ncbi:MAG: SIMPL domain-containing protein [Anaerolineales bacterium]|jgi:hypothetical protein
MRTRKWSIIVAMLWVTLLLGGCGGSQSEPTATGTPPPRNITVSGSGKVFLNPDIATISIGVHSEDESAARAVNGNNAQAQKVTEVLLEMGVEEDDIQTSNFNIYLEQRFDEEGDQAGTIYIVDNTVLVTMRDLNILGEIMGTVVEAGANSIFGIQFDVADKTQALSEARKAAVEDAQKKAEELALAAGVTLGEVQSINEYGGVPVPVFEGKGGAGFGATSDQVPISLGQLSLTVEVSVIYHIR